MHVIRKNASAYPLGGTDHSRGRIGKSSNRLSVASNKSSETLPTYCSSDDGLSHCASERTSQTSGSSGWVVQDVCNSPRKPSREHRSRQQAEADANRRHAHSLSPVKSSRRKPSRNIDRRDVETFLGGSRIASRSPASLSTLNSGRSRKPGYCGTVESDQADMLLWQGLDPTDGITEPGIRGRSENNGQNRGSRQSHSLSPRKASSRRGHSRPPIPYNEPPSSYDQMSAMTPLGLEPSSVCSEFSGGYARQSHSLSPRKGRKPVHHDPYGSQSLTISRIEPTLGSDGIDCHGVSSAVIPNKTPNLCSPVRSIGAVHEMQYERSSLGPERFGPRQQTSDLSDSQSFSTRPSTTSFQRHHVHEDSPGGLRALTMSPLALQESRHSSGFHGPPQDDLGESPKRGGRTDNLVGFELSIGNINPGCHQHPILLKSAIQEHQCPSGNAQVDNSFSTGGKGSHSCDLRHATSTCTLPAPAKTTPHQTAVLDPLDRRFWKPAAPAKVSSLRKGSWSKDVKNQLKVVFSRVVVYSPPENLFEILQVNKDEIWWSGDVLRTRKRKDAADMQESRTINAYDSDCLKSYNYLSREIEMKKSDRSLAFSTEDLYKMLTNDIRRGLAVGYPRGLELGGITQRLSRAQTKRQSVLKATVSNYNDPRSERRSRLNQAEKMSSIAVESSEADRLWAYIMGLGDRVAVEQ